MHMRMVLEVLAPRVQHSGDADVAPRCLGSPARVVSVTFSIRDASGTGSRSTAFTLHQGTHGQLFRMSEWENFYRRLAREARERAAQATNPSTRAALEKVASEWSELADWVERQHKRAAA